MNDPLGLADRLQFLYLQYLDSALPLRGAAVRALILYPLNALVEDQMIRLRQAADSVDNPDTGQPGARTWLDSQRPGLRFYFGRYTGRTPVSGYRTKSKKAELSRRRAELQR